MAAVDVAAMAAWIAAIPLEVWPQQSLRRLKPAMVTDRSWFGFGSQAAPVVAEVMSYFPGCRDDQWTLSAVLPGDAIEPHVDHQGPHWLCRIHVPLMTNPQSRFIVGGKAHCMEVSQAYRVNTEATHSVENDGEGARVHFMVDVLWP